MDEIAVITVLRKIKVLPTFPNIVRNLILLMEDPATSASDLKKHLDPSLASEILRVANTAYFGSRNFRSISSLEHAIAIIGFNHLSHILLQMPFLSLLQEGDSSFLRKGYVEHSMMTACLSKMLSELLPLAEPKAVYVAGLLHDVGIIVMYARMKQEWNRVLTLIRHGKGRLEAERQVLSFDHGYLGGLLLEMWNVPKEVVEAVMFHHNVESAREFKEYARVVSMANGLAKEVAPEEDMPSFERFFQRYSPQILPFCEHSPTKVLPLMERLYMQARRTKAEITRMGEGDDKGTHR